MIRAIPSFIGKIVTSTIMELSSYVVYLCIQIPGISRICLERISSHAVFRTKISRTKKIAKH